MNNYGLSSSEIFEIQANKFAFDKYNMNDPECDYSFQKKAVLTAINEVLTEKQRRYFIMYHINGLTVRKIAEMEGVNCGTVSRTLSRGKKRLYNALRFSNPVFLNANVPSRNRRYNNG